MSKFSEILYKCPGNQHGPNGKTFTWIGVTSEEQLKEKLEEGWCKSLSEACGLGDDNAANNSPPTRAELEEKAAALGIKNDKRMNDKTLLSKINEAIDNGLDKKTIR